MALRHGAHTRVAYTHFQGEPANLRNIGPLLRSLPHPHAAAIIQVGVLLLIATPVARVVFAVAAFLFERDWMFVAVSLVVLAVLLVGLLRVI